MTVFSLVTIIHFFISILINVRFTPHVQYCAPITFRFTTHVFKLRSDYLSVYDSCICTALRNIRYILIKLSISLYHFLSVNTLPGRHDSSTRTSSPHHSGLAMMCEGSTMTVFRLVTIIQYQFSNPFMLHCRHNSSVMLLV